MAQRLGFLKKSTTRRFRRLDARRLFALARVLGLVFLFLLPMQMRAGAADPHPHALLQLLLDARDGEIDHHADDGHAVHDETHASDSGSPVPDVPTFGESNHAGGGMAMLAALVAVFLIPATGAVSFWPSISRWTGRLPALDPPPPRS